MSAYFAGWDERVLDLVTERATTGLEAAQEALLRERTNEDDVEEFEFAVAAVHLAGLELQSRESERSAGESHPLPNSEFLARLEARGKELVSGLSEPAPSAAPDPRSDFALLPHPSSSDPETLSRPHSGGAFALAGWLVAAGILAVFLFPGLFDSGSALGPFEDAAKGRSELVARASDLKRGNWGETEDPLAAGVQGDFVWSAEHQQGYMRFSGLAANDPTEAQYQLWIFDATRADWEAKPVDGGVFDVSGVGEVIVPIDPKLEVRDAVLFAVTLEKPGGVVVSERERLIVTAGA